MPIRIYGSCCAPPETGSIAAEEVLAKRCNGRTFADEALATEEGGGDCIEEEAVKRRSLGPGKNYE